MKKIHSLELIWIFFGNNSFCDYFFFFLQLELMASLQSRLQALWEEQDLVLLEVRECAKWGEELEVMVRDLCKPSEFDRYMMFIGDLEKVVSLLLCLSSRLARVQNAMSRMDDNTEAEEKVSDTKVLNLFGSLLSGCSYAQLICLTACLAY